MNIDINQYDLNELFRFDLLKNILLNITNEQKKLEEEIKELKLSNKTRDNKIFKLEKYNNIKLYGIQNQLNSIDNNEIPNTNEEINLNKINEISLNYDKDKMNSEEINKIVNNEEDQNSSPRILENKNYNYEKETSSGGTFSDNKKNNKRLNLNYYNQNEKSRNSLLLFMKETHSLDEKINNLEYKLKNHFESLIQKIEEDSRNNIQLFSDEYKIFCEKLENKVSSIFQNNEEQNKKIENCLLKCDSIDIYNLLKDSGDGKIDATKVMINTLEEKVFKKFEFIEERHKKDSEDITKLVKSNENTIFYLEKLQKNLNDLKSNDLNQLMEIFRKSLSEYNEKIFDNINSVKDQELYLSSKINELENNLSNIINEKEAIVNKSNEDINKIQSNINKVKNEIDSFNTKQLDIYQNLENNVENKLNLHKSKINNIESTLKTITESFDIEKFKNDVIEIKSKLEEKITRENLKDLYNLHLIDVEDINTTRKTMFSIQDEVKKNRIDIENINPKIDSFMDYIASKKSKKKEHKKTEIDLTALVNKDTFEESIKYFTRKIESIFLEIDSMKRNLDDVKLEQNSFEKKGEIIKIEESIHNQIDENKSKIIKNKNELYKLIKGLEVEIKSIWEELKKRESSDTWILAKKPLQCFNCATCDNDIKIEHQKDEYMHWNKILSSNKSFIRGKGFSHILEKMTKDLINDCDEKNENENSKINHEKSLKNNSSIDINNKIQVEENKLISNDKNNNTIDNIAQIERSNFINKIPIIKGRNQRNINSVKMRLPQVVDKARKKAILDTFKNISSCTEREKYTIRDFSLKEQLRVLSPKILKIKKKDNSKSVSLMCPCIKDKL